MQQPGHSSSRKVFLRWGSVSLLSLTLLKIFNRRRPKEEAPVKMLTEDGQLVEVSKKMLSGGKKISDRELQGWIKK